MGIGNDLIGDVERLMAARVLRGKALHRMVGLGSHCWRAESEIQSMYPGTTCLLLPSATIGLALVLELLDLKRGSEVLISAFGWLSNWSCIVRAGLVPRFLPLDDELQLRAEDVERRISSRTGAVIVTHLMGRGQQAIVEISKICADRGIPLLEDIAQSFGVSVRGRRAGNFGLAAWCSLNHHKLLSVGDGGFVLSSNAEFFTRLSARHDHGCVIQDGKRVRAPKVEPGLSLRSSEVTAAVLRGQLARFSFIRTRVWRLHAMLAAACKKTLGVRLLEPVDGDIPFTVLFERPAKMQYPSLAESGWHVAANVPWLSSDFASAIKDDPAVSQTLHRLAEISAVGSGFVDPYFAIPNGVCITDDLSCIDLAGVLPRLTLDQASVMGVLRGD